MNNLEVTIVSIAKLSIAPNETLVLRVPDMIDARELSEIYDQFKNVVPAGVKIAVLPLSVELQVIAKEEENIIQ